MAGMRCPSCQTETAAGQKFCAECGARLETRCPTCQAASQPGQKFCSECGTRLQLATPAAAAAPPPPPAPASYTPPHLAERILTSRASLQGERKQVTVLFADLKGSMELLADRDPEEGDRILKAVLALMMEAVHRYEGTVNQVMGDGIMALFGAPLAHEDHAVRACYAALHMQERVREYADEIRRREGVLVQIRVGLNSGEVVVRSIGSDLKMDYTAVGQTVNLAARMEQMAAPGSILIAPAALQLAEGAVRVKALGPMAVKGLHDPIEVCEVIGAGAARTRFQAAALRGLTRFVGREAELETLRRTLEQAGAGQGQVVALVGEPGVGKSRLVWEFGHSHRAAGWLVLETRSVSYGKATSYLPVIDLLKAYCGIDAHDDPRRMREKLTGKLLTLDPALAPTLPAFQSLLDIPVDDPAWQNLDPPQRRQRTLDALKRLLLRESQEQPLLLVFEDLHWIDSETQALLDSLVESLPTAKLLLLVNYRPEYAHQWASKTYYSQLRLDPLPAASADELLAVLLGDDTALAPLKQTLIARTEGNPFFIEESVRTLVETGALSGEPGSYQLTQSVERTQVPATVQAVLAARIDRLPPEDKRLLQAASVIGKDVPLPLLRAIWDGDEAALHSGLTQLQAAEFLYETALFPEPEYTFKHALTHEVTYGSLLQERRRVLHAEIVEVIERLYPDRLGEQVEQLAYHALRGEVREKAATYSYQAGDRAIARCTFRQAVSHLDQALTALGQVSHIRTEQRQVLDIHLALRNALVPLGDFARVLEHLQSAEALAEDLGDRQRLGWVWVDISQYCCWAGDHKRAVEFGRRAEALAAELNDSAMKSEARMYLALALQALGDYAAAVPLAEQVLAAARRGDVLTATAAHAARLRPAPVAMGCWLSCCLVDIGEFDKALSWTDEALRRAELAQHPLGRVAGHAWRSFVLLRKGEIGPAVRGLQQALEISQSWQLQMQRPIVTYLLGYAMASDGRTDAALASLGQLGNHRHTAVVRPAFLLVLRSEIHLLAKQHEESIRFAASALASAQQHKERGIEAWALRLHGEIAAGGDMPDVVQAEGYYRPALSLAEELGMRPLVAHCHLGLGTLYGKVGRADEARAALTTAAEMYRGMEMNYWLAKAEEQLSQLAG